MIITESIIKHNNMIPDPSQPNKKPVCIVMIHCMSYNDILYVF